MRKVAKRGLAGLFVGALSMTMSVALAATIKPPQIQDAVATMSVVLGAPTGGPLDLTHTCTGADLDTYVTAVAKSTLGDGIASADNELAGPVVVNAKLLEDAQPTAPAGPSGEGVSTGNITLSPTAFPGTRWFGSFTSVIQVVNPSTQQSVGRGFINAAHQKYNKLLKKWVPDGRRLMTNVVEQIAPITSGDNAGKFQVLASFGPRTTPDASGAPVLGAKVISACP